jgi:SPOR domain
MAQDFAKKRKQGNHKTPARKSPQRARENPRGGSSRTANSHSRNGWRWYLAGLMTGVFLSFLLYLGSLPPAGNSNQDAQQAAAPEAPPRPRFDFYTLLPEQTMNVEVEPAEVTSPRAGSATELYLLQAGSFRQRDDADRRRAELLLLGLDPKVEETTGDNGRWFRVYVGPFDSRSKMAKARSLTAAQDIDTLLLKRNKP